MKRKYEGENVEPKFDYVGYIFQRKSKQKERRNMAKKAIKNPNLGDRKENIQA